MKYNRFYFILSLALLLIPGLISAQTIRNVAFFPIPYVAHKTFTANTAHFCSIDSPEICQVDNNLITNNIKAERDLELLAGASNTPKIHVGSLYNNYDITTGSFIVNAATNNQITISTSLVAGQINADNNLTLNSINWKYGTNTNIVFSNSLPGNLCWRPLRILGTYEYKYYLIKCP